MLCRGVTATSAHSYLAWCDPPAAAAAAAATQVSTSRKYQNLCIINIICFMILQLSSKVAPSSSVYQSIYDETIPLRVLSIQI